MFWLFGKYWFSALCRSSTCVSTLTYFIIQYLKIKFLNIPTQQNSLYVLGKLLTAVSVFFFEWQAALFTCQKISTSSKNSFLSEKVILFRLQLNHSNTFSQDNCGSTNLLRKYVYSTSHLLQNINTYLRVEI